MLNADAVSTTRTLKKPRAENRVSEWHPTKNGDLDVGTISSGSNKKVSWLGECGHEWEATVYTRPKHGCPCCTGRNAIPLLPNEVKEWSSKKMEYLVYGMQVRPNG